jgi:murein DD-endopeptidase MepM/ murein hydrolase activator NlpD
MWHWGHHRTRSKVALLLLINLVALLGGKYMALITIMKIELFGEAIAFAKGPKKKPPKPHLNAAPAPHDHPPPPASSRPVPVSDGAQRRAQEIWHVIRRGETLSEIAAAYGLSVDALRRANRLPRTGHLIVGESLRIPAHTRHQTGVKPHQLPPASGQALLLTLPRRFERPPQAPTPAPDGFLWPVEGQLTSPFGEREHAMGGGGTQFHAGIDISVPTGTPVRATQEGTVVFAGYNGAYGKVVKLDHPNGFSTLYAHNSRILVHVGQTIQAGQVICLSGSSGRSTGPHLHFEVHKDGWPLDPLPHLK